MLFTDIEGSTLLLRALGPAYADVLAAQRQIMRAAIASHEGHEMGTEGDSFFVVFASAEAGVATAVDAQRALQRQAWPSGHQVRVRMGLHVGELARHDEGYVGLDLNRAARIASTANGAQIVVSEPMRHALSSDRSLGFRDLGLHRLKDLPTPEHLYRLVVDGLLDIDTPIKSLGAPTNLPSSRGSVLGRDLEMDEVQRLVRGGTRLVTLTGPGGVGKTTLSLALASQLENAFPAGIYFVALESARQPSEAWTALTGALGAGDESDHREGVLAFLSRAPCLLVLDNLEQLQDAGTLVADLLDHTSSTVVATSRGPLHIRGEVQYTVRPLDVPTSLTGLEAIGAEPAVELFVREARRAHPSFALTDSNAPIVLEICARVEGLPLAIELIASRVRVGLDAIVRALEDRLVVASRDVDRPDRQRTIGATVAWSYDLLNPTLQGCFARLSVFAASAGIEAVAEVLRDVTDGDPFDVLEALADVSLVGFVDSPDGSPRVSMLRVVRDFAAARLAASGDETAARRLHASYFAGFAEEAVRRLRETDYLMWSDRLALDYENIRDAFEWSMSVEAHREPAARITAALGWFWYARGRAAEGRKWLERVARDGHLIEPELHMKVLQPLGVLQQLQGQNDAAVDSFERALELARRLGNRSFISRSMNSLGVAYLAEGRLDLARERLSGSADIARADDDQPRLSTALANLGLVQLAAGAADEAAATFEEALAIDRRLGDAWAVAIDETNLGAAIIRKGDLQEGHAIVASTLPTVIELDDPDLLASAIEVCAIAAAVAGDPHLATVLIGGADRIRTEVGVPRAPSEEAYLEREYGPARASLGRAASDAAAEEGRGASLDELVRLAREDVAATLVGRGDGACEHGT